MGLFKNGLSALGRLLTVVALAGTFIVGLVGVVYLQLRGEEITIPKIVGKDFNDGKDELTLNGLRIKKIASRYSNEDPNTILEQRPKAGTVAKTGLMISVVVSEPNPDGSEEPVDVKDDEEAIEEIESLPELKTDKAKKKAKAVEKKKETKSRDVVKTDDKSTQSDAKSGDDKKDSDGKKDSGSGDSKKPDVKKEDNPSKPKDDNKPPQKKADETKPKSNGDTRSRKVPPSN